MLGGDRREIAVQERKECASRRGREREKKGRGAKERTQEYKKYIYILHFLPRL